MSDRVPLPRYTAAVIYTCPECWGDLEHAGLDEYWCRACQQTVHFTQVGLYQDRDLDD